VALSIRNTVFIEKIVPTRTYIHTYIHERYIKKLIEIIILIISYKRILELLVLGTKQNSKRTKNKRIHIIRVE